MSYAKTTSKAGKDVFSKVRLGAIDFFSFLKIIGKDQKKAEPNLF